MSDVMRSRSPQNFAHALKSLIDARGLKQKALATQVGLTESSLSMILNAKARPRQLTLTRLLNRLNCSPHEEQTILAAYDHAEGGDLPLRPGLREKPIPPDELERVRRYLKIKAESVAFEEQVNQTLTKIGLPYERNCRTGDLICDFLISRPLRIAIECQFNVDRDLDRTLATVSLFQKELEIDEVIVVFPNGTAANLFQMQEREASGCHFLNLDSLKPYLIETTIR